MTKELNHNIIDYTEYPGPRYKNQGEYSGEFFYEKYLKPLMNEAIATDTVITVNLDGTAGYAASFIDELFGNIVYDFSVEKFDKHIEVISSEEPEWLDVIIEVKKDWKEKKEKGNPRKPRSEK